MGNPLKVLGNSIVANRERAGLTLSELGNAVGVKGSLIKKHEEGNGGKIDLSLLAKIADSLGKSVSDLVPSRHNVSDVTNLELDNVELTYAYRFVAGDKRYTVIASRDATPGNNSQFELFYLDWKGQSIPEGALTGILRSKMLDIVKELRNQKKAYSQK